MSPDQATGSRQTARPLRRRPRFQRVAPTPFRMTDGDLQIITWLATHRYLQAAQVAALVGRSLDRTNDRLRKLYDAGFLDRPVAQRFWLTGSGSLPMVYALAPAGAQLLTTRQGSDSPRAAPRTSRPATYPFIAHQLAVADFWVALFTAIRARSDVQLVTPDRLAAQCDRAHLGSRAFALSADLPCGDNLEPSTVVPDSALALQFPDGSRRCFLVEIDRGTMPVTRNAPGQTSFLKKLQIYAEAHAARQHQHEFGWKTFRLLTVTTSARRAALMRAAVHQIDAHPLSANVFLFAQKDQVQRNPMDRIWLDGSGQPQSLA